MRADFLGDGEVKPIRAQLIEQGGQNLSAAGCVIFGAGHEMGFAFQAESELFGTRFGVEIAQQDASQTVFDGGSKMKVVGVSFNIF